MNSIFQSLNGPQRQDAFTRQLLSRLKAGERQVSEKLFEEFPEISSDEELVIELLFRELLYYQEDCPDEPIDARAWTSRYPQRRERLNRLLNLYQVMGDDTHRAIDETLNGDFRDHPVGPGSDEYGGRGLDNFSPIDLLESHSLALDPDKRQIGQYELLHFIKRGGMGVVYRARQSGLDRNVALKVIENARFDADQLARFQREAETAASFVHPNVVPIYEVGQHDGRAFIAMELVAGGDLAERTKQRPLPPAQAARLLKSLALAIHAAHQRGIIHRDLKPGNVLLTHNDSVADPKIADFGLAKRIGHEPSYFTKNNAVIGTPGFMSPEQASGDAGIVGTSSDVYGLGAILYQCLTGAPPFEGNSVEEILRKVRDESVTPPRSFQSSIPLDLQAICLKCLDKDPQNRYETSLQLAADVQNFLDGKVVMARPLLPLGRLGKWARRQPALAILSMALILTTIAAVLAMAASRNTAIYRARVADEREQEAVRLQRIAERDKQRSIKVINHMLESLGQLTQVSGTEAIRKQLFEGIKTIYQESMAEHQDNPWLQAEARKLSAELSAISVRFGDFQAAFNAIENAIAIDRKVCDRENATTGQLMNLAGGLHARGYLNRRLRNPKQSCRDFSECILLYELCCDQDKTERYRGHVENAKTNLASALTSLGKHEEASRWLAEATDYFGTRYVRNHRDFHSGIEYSICLDEHASAFRKMRKYQKAYEMALKSIEVREHLLKLRPDDEALVVLMPRSYATASRMAHVLNPGSEDDFKWAERATHAYQRYSTQTPDPQLKSDLAAYQEILGRMHWAAADRETANKYFRDCIDQLGKIVRDNPKDFKHVWRLAGLLLDCPVESLRDSSRVLIYCQSILEDYPKSPGARQMLVRVLYAERQYVECLRAFVDLLPFGSTSTVTTTAIAACLRLNSLQEVRSVFESRHNQSKEQQIRFRLPSKLNRSDR